MIKINELNKALGWVLFVATVGSYIFLQSKAAAYDGLGAIFYSLYYVVLFPVTIIGLSVGMASYEKFSNGSFKVGAFFLLVVLLYILWQGPTFWWFTLIVGSISGGLLFTLIKLSDATARLVFVLTGMLLTTFILVAASAL